MRHAGGLFAVYRFELPKARRATSLVGCLTLTSNLPGEASELQRMDDGLKTEFHRVLVDGMRESLEA